MFKNLESAWNSRTPVWLHNGTKENIIFQLVGTVVICGGMMAYWEWKDRQEEKRYKNIEHLNAH